MKLSDFIERDITVSDFKVIPTDSKDIFNVEVKVGADTLIVKNLFCGPRDKECPIADMQWVGYEDRAIEIAAIVITNLRNQLYTAKQYGLTLEGEIT